MPTAVNATDSTASTAPRPPGVGTAEPKVLASRKMKVVPQDSCGIQTPSMLPRIPVLSQG